MAYNKIHIIPQPDPTTGFAGNQTYLQFLNFWFGSGFHGPDIIDQTDPNNVYFGYRQSSAVTTLTTGWIIKKISTAGAIVTTTFADDSLAFDHQWSLRATYVYNIP